MTQNVMRELVKLAQLETGAPGYDSWVRDAKPIRSTADGRPEHDAVDKLPVHTPVNADAGAPRSRVVYDTNIDMER